MSTKRMNTVLVIGFLLCLTGRTAICEINKSITSIDDYVGGIAFLLEGDIYLSNTDGSEIKALTVTDGNVEDFRFSPDLKYLAYAKVIGMREGIGYVGDGEEAGETETWSIEIVNLVTMSVVFEIEPEDDWLYLAKWSAFDRLIYYSSSGYDISGYYHYDAGTNSTALLDYNEGYELFLAETSATDDEMVYVDDIGLGKNFQMRLHIVNLSTNEDRIVASKRVIFNPCLSHEAGSVAFLETQTVDSQWLAIIWIYSPESDSLDKLTTFPRSKKGNSSMSWSVGDSCLGMFFSPSQFPNGYIFPLTDPSDVHELSGKQFCWIGDDAILYSRGASDIFRYDLKDRKEKLLIEKATHPTYLTRAN